MDLKHRVRINVTRPGGVREAVLSGGSKSIRSRFLSRLLGSKVSIFVLVPNGGSVSSVEIHEEPNGGDTNEVV